MAAIAPSRAPRQRRSYARLPRVIDVPNLIDIQVASFRRFMEEGLREVIDDISPIEDYTGTLAVEFGEYAFDPPPVSIRECREKDLTYSAPLSVTVRFINKSTGEIREQRVFMGDFPLMTEWGTFIINGTERVVVTQLVRSPGAYILEPKDAAKQLFTANLMPSRGSWLELEIDKKGLVTVRIDRKRKLPITTLLRALPHEDPTTGFVMDTTSNEAIVDLFRDPKTKEENLYIGYTLEKDITTRADEALIEVFKKQRPGEPPTLDNARALLRSLFFDPKRYDLTKVGRYKLNLRLHGWDDTQGGDPPIPMDVRVLTTRDILTLARKLVSLPDMLGVPHDSRDYADDCPQPPARSDRARARRVRALRQPPAARRRRADPGGLPHRPLPHGARRARAHDDRGRGHDHASDDHQHPSGRRGAEGVLRLVAALAVHGPDELARRPHPPPPPLGARRGRPHARARAHRGARRPLDPLRAHVPDRDPGGPEHRPHRLALELRHRVRVRLHPGAVPQGGQGQAERRDHLPRRLQGRAPRHRAVQRRDRQDRQARSRRCSCAGAAASPIRSRPRPSTTWTSRPSRSSRSRRR